MTIDREDVSQFIKTSSRFLSYYGNDGQETDHMDKACAYKATQDDSVEHFCRFTRGVLYDPQGIDAKKKSTSEFKKVNASAFGFYIEYLENKKRILYVRADRSLIDV